MWTPLEQHLPCHLNLPQNCMAWVSNLIFLPTGLMLNFEICLHISAIFDRTFGIIIDFKSSILWSNTIINHDIVQQWCEGKGFKKHALCERYQYGNMHINITLSINLLNWHWQRSYRKTNLQLKIYKGPRHILLLK